MKDNIQLAREKTRNSVADITGWCLVVALHQRFGMGRDRLVWLAFAAGLVYRALLAICERGKR